MTNNKTINSFWISGPLSEMNILTIKSFVENGHEFHLYCYDVDGTITNLVEHGVYSYFRDCKVLVWDANIILLESEIYYYKNMAGGNPAFKFGGIAERLKAEMLYKLGGWHVDLDVTCLQHFDFRFKDGKIVTMPNGLGFPESEYVLRPHNSGGIVANIIKAPAQSEFARRYVEHTKTITADNTIWEKSFTGLNQIVKDLQLEKYILPANVLGDDSDLYYRNFTKYGYAPEPELHAVHWCAARQLAYEPGSFYESLLIKYKLV